MFSSDINTHICIEEFIVKLMFSPLLFLRLICNSDSFSTSTTGHTDKKYIVFEKNIMELFQRCPRCSKSPELKTYRRGTFLSIDQICHHCEFFRQWKSQPLIKSTPVGNIQLSAAVYFSGSSFYQVQKVKYTFFNFNTLWIFWCSF